MSRATSDRRTLGERGAIGTMIVVWVLVVVAIGIALIDAGSIVLTKFQLSDVASSAATQAANAYRGNQNEAGACQAAVQSIATDDQTAQLAKKGGCVIDPTTGAVTITVRKVAKTILAGRLGFTKRFAKVLATETNGPSNL